jgi:hypothetical protein
MKFFQFITLVMLSLFLGKVESLGFDKIDNFSNNENSIGKSLNYTSPTQIQPFSTTESPNFFFDLETENEDDDETSLGHYALVKTYSFSALLNESCNILPDSFKLTTPSIKKFILYCSLRLHC